MVRRKYIKKSAPDSLIIALILIVSASCQRSREHTITDRTDASSKYEEMDQDFKNLYECFEVEHLLEKKQHFLLVAGQEFGIMHSFFIKSSLDDTLVYDIDVFQFKLAHTSDSPLFTDTCRLNHVVYNRLEYKYLKKKILNKKDLFILSRLDTLQSENSMGRFDSFSITLCEYSRTLEVRCVNVFRKGGSALEFFYDNLIGE